MGFEDSTYASGEFFREVRDPGLRAGHRARQGDLRGLQRARSTREDWAELAEKIKKGGLYNRNLQAVPPTGSISYINNSTSSIHPIVAKVGDPQGRARLAASTTRRPS